MSDNAFYIPGLQAPPMATKLSPMQKDYVMLHLIRSEKVLTKALIRLDPIDFDPQTEGHYAILWAVTREFYTAHRRLIPQGILRAQVKTRVSADPDWANDPFRQNLLEELITITYACEDKELVSDWAVTQLQALLDDRKVRHLANAVHTSANLQEMMETINQAYASSRLATKGSVNPFDLSRAEANVPTAPRTATGFAPLDTLLAGGPRQGDLILLLGPIGGGKTMMAVLTAIAAAKLSKTGYVDFFTFEEPVDPNLRERFWTAACGDIPRKEIEGKKLHELSEHVVERLKKVEKEVDRVRTFDFSKSESSSNGPMDIENCIQQEILEGREPCGIVVDWAGIMATRWQGEEVAKDPTKMRFALQIITDKCKQIAQKYNVWFLLCHQLSTEAGKQKAGSTLDQYAGADSRQFSSLCDTFITIGTTCVRSKVCAISNPKSRAGEKARIWVRVDDVCHQMWVQKGEYISRYDPSFGSYLAPKDYVDVIGSSEFDEGTPPTPPPASPPNAVNVYNDPGALTMDGTPRTTVLAGLPDTE